MVDNEAEVELQKLINELRLAVGGSPEATVFTLRCLINWFLECAEILQLVNLAPEGGERIALSEDLFDMLGRFTIVGATSYKVVIEQFNIGDNQNGNQAEEGTSEEGSGTQEARS